MLRFCRLAKSVILAHRLRESGDSGNPLVLADPSAPAAIQLAKVADSLASKGRGLAGRMLSLSPR